MSDAVVIIPTYNEKENVERMTRKVMSLEKDFHILFVDDSSPDGTATIIRHLMDEFPGRIFLEERRGKLGLGTAYIHGFKWAINRKYDYIFEMDCDFSHNPDDLIRLYKACAEGGADLSIGSRYTKGGKVENWPMKRLLLSFFASIYVRMILWISIRDTTAGFKCYKRNVLETINLDGNTFKGYAFQICMKYAAVRHGFKAKEVPITFIDRIYGESKMSTSIFKEAFIGVWKMRTMKL
ncbi:polyprenol monophosphomannose synthase [Crocinitomicaceae bacterium CZZ-1]|uniref:Polyprenol monophosphomannose synthase n=1 Tax=Taishania pollutisoli TaxID=2766479 RepID=A0A8J6TZ96_9FLAO|nr:polyprenol monophosphomannose synthase [Taishania pollutisoli]MBC9811843.1 polyprenol monophosphomannose synthase [Taishania pollutisoli]MBX2948217.1 polyprenol monophosphomannose synthase [Crocinitomicaceae bacterium]NGF75320.1 polyprenol monophosphomannose synthase [Fluviicola sp. SGL-29]